MNLVEKAIVFAVKAHLGDLRKGNNIPYILHPTESAAIVASMTENYEVIAAAILHDVIEDTSFTKEDMAREFGEYVAELVQEVSGKGVCLNLRTGDDCDNDP